MRQMAGRMLGLVGLLWLGMLASAAQAAWHDPAWTFRRSLQLTLSAERVNGDELARCTFLSNSKHKADGSDFRVVTAGGRVTRSRVVSVGAGDEIELVFDTVKGIRDYYVYFANGKPPAVEDAVGKGGLLMEMRQWNGQPVEKIADLPAAFEASKTVLGKTMLQRIYQGVNPFGMQERTVSKLSGSLFAPIDGEYVFAVAADDRGALYLDDKPVVFARYGAGDSRFQDRVYLKRGWHALVFYHVNISGDGPFGVFWRRPDMEKLEIVGRESFGLLGAAQAGPLEQVNRPLTADMSSEYKGEAFYAGNYSHRVALALRTTFAQSDRVQWHWEFGDGQSADGKELEHVFLTSGLREISVTAKAGQLSDTQTFRISVDRDWSRVDRPPTDELGIHSRMVSTYDVSRMATGDLPWAVLLNLRAGNMEAVEVVAMRLAGLTQHPSRAVAIKALEELQQDWLKRGRLTHMVDVWRAVPADSDLQPWAGCELAEVLCWWQGDVAGALKAIEPLAKGDDRARRVYGQMLVLNRRVEEGRKVLDALPSPVSLAKQAAVGGAMARTTEFYITEGRWEDGEEAWEKWQSQFPVSFLEGHSMLLRVGLMELRKSKAAAMVAEAFANAVPQSPYSPQLLDKASKLLLEADPAKAKSLRELLKQRYPENPLSQDTPLAK